MDVKTPREINLAFLSLIKLFSEVKVEQKSITLNPKPRLPSSVNAAGTQQVCMTELVRNKIDFGQLPLSRFIQPFCLPEKDSGFNLSKS